MGLTRTPLIVCIATTVLAAVAIWIPLQMQGIVAPYNDVCTGPLTDTDLRILFRVRYLTWAASLIATGLCLLAIFRLRPNIALRWVLGGTFAIWKLATLFTDTFASPDCWESYDGAGPFWDEPFGTAVMFVLQPIAFLALFAVLLCLTAWIWLSLIVAQLKNRHNPTN